jgi:hypothetical protein
MPGSPRLARGLRKSNRLLVFVKTSNLTGVIKLRRRVRSPPNGKPRLARLRAVTGFLLGCRIRGHVVHDDVHIRPDVEVA